MAISLMKTGFRSAILNIEKSAGVLAFPGTWQSKRVVHTKQDGCTGTYCVLSFQRPLPRVPLGDAAPFPSAQPQLRAYSKHHGTKEERRKRDDSDSDSDSDSDTKCKGIERTDFWRRKMRTVHNILDVDKDGLISYGDFALFARRFIERGHLDEQQAAELTNIMKILRTVHNILDVDKDGLISYGDFALFARRFIERGHLDEQQAAELTDIMKMTWEEQWGAVDPYNFVTVEQYLEDMHHVLNDKALKKKAHRWLPYLFQAVDKDKSGSISVVEYKMFFECLGLDNEHAAISFAVIDTNGDGKLSLKEFVKLGKDFFFTEDERKVSKMFWGPLVSR